MTAARVHDVDVCIPIGGFNLSGGVKVLVLIANGMAARGWRVSFVAPDFAAESPFPLAPDVSVTTLGSGPRWLPLSTRKILYYLHLGLVAARGARVCLANYYPTAFCAVLSRWVCNRASRVVWYVQADEAVSHGLLAEAGRASRLLRYGFARLSHRLPLSTICVSRWVRSRIGHPADPVRYAPAVDPAVFHPGPLHPDRGRLVVGTIGRRGKTKGYEVFLEAVRRLPRPHDLKILVASPTPDEVPLPVGVDAEGVHTRSDQAMAEFYRRCDIFVLPSRMEAFPLPPLEAMACGCAVVSTACGGVEDYAENGVNCLLVPPGDPASLAAAVWTACTDDPLRSRLARHGAMTARRFERDAMVREFVALVSEVFEEMPAVPAEVER